MFGAFRILALVLAAGLISKSAQGRPYEVPQDRRQTIENDIPAVGVARDGEFSIPVRVIENAPEVEHAKERERILDQHDADDLEAQRDAADASQRSAAATEWQLFPAWAQLILAIFGTGGLIYSLHLTRAALKSSRSTAESELRAYLDVQPSFMFSFDATTRPGGRYEAKNVGATPAYGCAKCRCDHIAAYSIT